MSAELLAALVFVPLVTASLSAVSPAPAARLLAVGGAFALPAMLWPLTLALRADGPIELLLAGYAVPLGIRLKLDGLSLMLLWLVALVTLAASLHAWSSIGATRFTRRFWPLWGLMLTGSNLMLVSADLFNLYVGLELLTLAAVALVAYGASIDALRAAMRYLLLAMLGSLVYLLGVALVYSATGTLDLALASRRLADSPVQAAALALMTGGLLLKSAIFPLHGWLPFAHANAPGPVSAALSGLVVKASLYLMYRLWFELLPGSPPLAAGQFLAALGAGAVIFGSLLALRQQRLKRLIAYSTVAQLGYLTIVFAIPTPAAWQGSIYQMLSHGLAKAAMFLAAANLMRRLGGDGLDRLAGADARLPVSAFAFGLAGVSLMGLPPSGGFLAKWLLLSAAWAQGQWAWVAVLLIGSLLAAAYLFRVLARMFARPAAESPTGGSQPARLAEAAALALALAAIAAGFVSAPILDLLGLPATLAPGQVDGAPR